jgi:hypothetical protein
MRNFEYRRPRLASGFTVEFTVDNETLHGLCRDANDAGIRVELDGVVIIGSLGTLVLRYHTRVLSREARVAYIEKQQVGLSFVIQTLQDNEETSQFINLLCKARGIS